MCWQKVSQRRYEVFQRTSELVWVVSVEKASTLQASFAVVCLVRSAAGLGLCSILGRVVVLFLEVCGSACRWQSAFQLVGGVRWGSSWGCLKRPVR